MPEKTYTGGCLCGALRYEATAAPLVSGEITGEIFSAARIGTQSDQQTREFPARSIEKARPITGEEQGHIIRRRMSAGAPPRARHRGTAPQIRRSI